MTEPSKPQADNSCRDSFYWFARLELALDRGDFATAAVAKRALASLGVVVRHVRPASDKQGEVADAAR
jgi:hypothetical protein